MISKLLSKALYKIPNLCSPPHSPQEYASILDTALNEGYSFFTLGELHANPNHGAKPFMILRHDIDTNPQAALRFAEIEEARGIKATYFFRICTWHPAIMSVLQRRGHEIGYHFEELSAFAVHHHLRDKESVIQHFPDIREKFRCNLATLRQTVDFEISALAAHGDFTYPLLDLGNRRFLQDAEFRLANGIAYEAYDKPLVNAYAHHISDKPAPLRYYPKNPLEIIKLHQNLLFLSHPRWWICDPKGNLRSDLEGYYRQIRW